MKVFISHAVADRKLIEHFLDLLRLGGGLGHNDIFCSSDPAAIPAGVPFLEHILSELKGVDLVVAVLSRSYMKSDFCIAEVGAARVLRVSGAQSLHPFPFIVPPMDFSGLPAVLEGVQCKIITNHDGLDELRDGIGKAGVSTPSTADWTRHRDNFLAMIRPIIDSEVFRELLRKRLTRNDLLFDCADPKSTIQYKSKLRVVFINETGSDFQIKAFRWIAEPGEVPLQSGPQPYSIELEGPGGWTNDHWLAASFPMKIISGQAFRLWVGLNQSFGKADLRRRWVTSRLGTVELTITIGGQSILHQIRL
jgi:hypothetical protein